MSLGSLGDAREGGFEVLEIAAVARPQVNRLTVGADRVEASGREERGAALVDEQRDLVCGMNRDLLCGMADAVGEDVLAARLAPSEGSCCVRLDIKQRAPKER